jgi:hypothetical protein
MRTRTHAPRATGRPTASTIGNGSQFQPLEARRFLSAAPVADATPAAATLPAPVVVGPGSSTSPGPALTTFEPTFTWKAVTGVTFTAYQINVYDEKLAQLTTYTAPASATSFKLTTPLAAGDDIVWNLRLDDGTTSGPPSTYLYFSTPTDVTIPAPVVTGPGSTTSPGPVLTTSTPTFTWHAVTGANVTSYQLNLKNVTTGAVTSYSVAGTAASFTLPTTLASGDDYVWNLGALDGSVYSPASTALYFQAPATLPAPVVIGPGSTASPGPVLSTTVPTFTWDAVTGVTFTGYQLNLENLTTSTFTSYQIAKTATSFTPPTALGAGDQFVWNLRLVNGNVSGPPSTYLYFTTPGTASLPAPVVVSPGSTTSPGPALTTSKPTFTWDAVTGVTFTGYQLNLKNVTTGTLVSYAISKTATSFTLPTALTTGDDYVWNLGAVNGSVYGPASAALYFQVPAATATLPAPVVIGPGSTASPGPVLTTFAPTFTWDAVTGVTFTAYQINLYDVTTSVSTTYTVATTATSFTLTSPLTPGNAYVWNLRLDNGTASGPPSTYLYFTAPPVSALPAPVILSPGGSASPGTVITSTTPTFTWDAVTGVAFDTYQLNLYDETAAKFLTFQIANTATSFTPPAGTLAAGDAFVWNLRLNIDGTTGMESNYLYFQTP